MRFLVSIIVLILISNQVLGAPNIPLQKNIEPPLLLSQTGIFEGDISLLKPASEFKTYEIIQPLFADFAQKQRMVYVPSGTHVGFSPDEPYLLPVGTIFVKHFRMEIMKGVFQNLETRILVRQEGEDKQSWMGYTYKWDGSEARLVGARVNAAVSLHVDASAPGGKREQVFKIPNRVQCLQCHNSSVGYVRSFETRQLNRLVGNLNQLSEFNRENIFDHDIGSLKKLESYASIDDESEPLEKRVKSYLTVNCSHCHNPDPAAMCFDVGLDFRFANFSADALVASGHLMKRAKDKSELFLRMNSTAQGYRMPFIGAALRDDKAVEAVGRWIDQL